MKEQEYAFPLVNQHGVFVSKGMSLRDYFAAKAMQAMISMGEIPNNEIPEEYHGKQMKTFIAESAYVFADAMLKAREEK